MASNPKDDGTADPSASERDAGNAKGKQVASDKPAQQSPRQADSDTFVSRLTNSAADLSRGVFWSPSISAGDLAKLSASSGKPGPSSSSAGAAHYAAATSSSTARSLTPNSKFRPGHADAHIAAGEAAFSAFLDGTSVAAPTEPTVSSGPWETPSEASSQETGSIEHELPSGVAISTAKQQQQQQDGAEVVHLLSQLVEDVPELENQVQLDSKDMDNLRRALFETRASTQISASEWNNMLNFIPDFLRDDTASAAASAASSMNLGVTDRPEASQLWLEDWNRVLTGYTDEVWGDLGDLAQAARNEVQQIRREAPSQRTEPSAVRQLQSVLRRIRARL